MVAHTLHDGEECKFPNNNTSEMSPVDLPIRPWYLPQTTQNPTVESFIGHTAVEHLHLKSVGSTT